MTVAPSPIDLTTVADVKSWLGQGATTGSDDPIQKLITNVSRFLITYCSRTFLPATYTERYDGYGAAQSRQMLSQWPVISIASMSIGNNAVAAAPVPGPGSTYGSGYLLSPGQAQPPGAQQWLDFHGFCLPRGSQNIGVTYRAGYLAVDTGVIPGTPFAVAALSMWGLWRTDEGVTIAGVAAVAVSGTPTTGQYKVDAAGNYTFAAADVGKAYTLSYGYVPADLVQAAIEMIALRWTSKGFIGLVSKSLGGQETVTFSQKDMSDAIATMLQSYRRVF